MERSCSPMDTFAKGSRPIGPLGDSDDVEKVFRHFDANGDDKISTSELTDVVRALSGSDGRASTDEVRKMMEEKDADGDGFVDLAEFVAFHRGGGVGVAGKAATGGGQGEGAEGGILYVRLERGREDISAKELHQVLKRLGDKCSVRDCSRMISSVDVDGDGCVNFQEFKKMMTDSDGKDADKNHHHRRHPK